MANTTSNTGAFIKANVHPKPKKRKPKKRRKSK